MPRAYCPDMTLTSHDPNHLAPVGLLAERQRTNFFGRRPSALRDWWLADKPAVSVSFAHVRILIDYEVAATSRRAAVGRRPGRQL